MHEVTVAQTVVDSVLAEAESQGAESVTKITLVFGELALINVEQISFWISSFLEETIAAGAELTFETVAGKVECRDCGTVSDVAVDPDDKLLHYAVPDFTCSSCGSPNTFICQGREMLIKNIQVVR